MENNVVSFREVDHTADRALCVWASDLPSLFVHAASGMFYLMAGSMDHEPPAGWQRIELGAIDRESLLVEWLNELLFLAEEGGRLFVAFRIDCLTDTHLKAQAGWVPGRPTKAQIKAATYHNLQIVETDGSLSVELTFDV